jgi:hypothetical protein
MAYQSFLSIRHDGKGIPYDGLGEPRPDGGANFGFKNLKREPGLIETVPELQKDADLKSVVAIINHHASLFSVGCDSGAISDQQGFRRKGYVEFAINSKRYVQDATNYFQMFFHFDRSMAGANFGHRVQFNWELQGATFIDSNTSGLTCTVWLQTHPFPDSLTAEQSWCAALAALGQFLPGVPVCDGEPIY